MYLKKVIDITDSQKQESCRNCCFKMGYCPIDEVGKLCTRDERVVHFEIYYPTPAEAREIEREGEIMRRTCQRCESEFDVKYIVHHSIPENDYCPVCGAPLNEDIREIDRRAKGK